MSDTLYLPFLIVAGIFAYLGVNSKKDWMQFFFTVACLGFVFIGIAEGDYQGANFGDEAVSATVLVTLIFMTLWFIQLIMRVLDYLRNTVS